MALGQRRSDVLGLRVRPHHPPRNASTIHTMPYGAPTVVLLQMTAHALALIGAGDLLAMPLESWSSRRSILAAASRSMAESHCREISHSRVRVAE